MSALRKVVLLLVLCFIAFVSIFVGDWYRFVKYAELDPKRGVYGNDHLEVWIDINLMMPAPMRAWGCKTLAEREEKVLGFKPARNPYGCNPELESMAPIDVYMMGYVANAEMMLAQKNPTPEQKETVKACVKTDLMAAMKPEQQEALKAGKDADAVIAITQLATKVTNDCIAKAGL